MLSLQIGYFVVPSADELSLIAITTVCQVGTWGAPLVSLTISSSSGHEAHAPTDFVDPPPQPAATLHNQGANLFLICYKAPQ